MAIEVGRVKQNSYGDFPENQEQPARINRRGELVVMDFWTQLVLDGRMFHMQIGTEDAPVNSTTSIDDALVWMLVDGAAGTVFIPTLYEVNLAQPATATLSNVMLEIDRAKARYSSGGTAFVPENLRTDRPRVSVAAASYVGTDITAAAKTAVPGSIELARRSHFDTTPSATNEPSDFQGFIGPVFSVRHQIPAVVVGVGSILCHFGVATADATGYGILQWAELPTSSVT